MQDERTVVVHNTAELIALPTRRNFLKALGLGGTLVLMPSLFAACTDDTGKVVTGGATTAGVTISLASDIGIFQFAAALEGLESSYYEQVVGLSSFSSLFSAAEQEMLSDIRNDEVTHRAFFKAALGSAYPNLSYNFASVLANPNRSTLLTTALTLETNGIAAYNGAGPAIKNANNLLVAGKIVSIEARHTSALADSLDTTGTAYADLTAAVLNGLGADPMNALDAAVASEATVASNAQPFIRNPITLA
ncbi:MAG TPA: ferritin-like domain-containing protein [Gemmatirosa sp.]